MILVILIVLGLSLGSFINAYEWRLRSQGKKGKYSNLSVWHGRSMCPNCHHTLSGKDLIPVFSWLVLGGKCRYCKTPINWQYPLVEIVTAFLYVLSYVYWPYGFGSQGLVLFIFWLIFLLGFIVLTIIDLRTRTLPNKIVTPLILLAVLQIVIQLIFFNAGLSLVLGSIWGVLFSAGFFYGIFVISEGKWIGGGDVKLAIALGLILGGPLESILMVFLAALIGCLIAITLMAAKKLERNSLIAFGPLLMSATIICYLYGAHIITWYKNIVF